MTVKVQFINTEKFIEFNMGPFYLERFVRAYENGYDYKHSSTGIIHTHIFEYENWNSETQTMEKIRINLKNICSIITEKNYEKN